MCKVNLRDSKTIAMLFAANVQSFQAFATLFLNVAGQLRGTLPLDFPTSHALYYRNVIDT